MLSFMQEQIYSRWFKVFLFLGVVWPNLAGSWEIDLSRRQQLLRNKEMTREPASTKQPPGFFEKLLDSREPVQDIVILNTKNGFVPQTIHLRTDLKYHLYVVNVNREEKNVSFILDAFSEHHATYYGTIKDFIISPKKEGIFPYQCPETSEQGKVIVHAAPQTGLHQPVELSERQ